MPSKAKGKQKRAEKALEEAAEYARRRREGESSEAIAEYFGIAAQTVMDRIRLHKAPKKIKNATPKLGVSLIEHLLRLLRHYGPEHIMELICGALKPNGEIDEVGYERCRVAAGDRGKEKRLQYARKRQSQQKHLASRRPSARRRK